MPQSTATNGPNPPLGYIESSGNICAAHAAARLPGAAQRRNADDDAKWLGYDEAGARGGGGGGGNQDRQIDIRGGGHITNFTSLLTF